VSGAKARMYAEDGVKLREQIVCELDEGEVVIN
jgi:hypothetical protein